MRLLFVVFLVALVAMTAAAADVTGKWSGSFTLGDAGGDGGTAFLVLKQSGSTISGRRAAPRRSSSRWRTRRSTAIRLRAL